MDQLPPTWSQPNTPPASNPPVPSPDDQPPGVRPEDIPLAMPTDMSAVAPEMMRSTGKRPWIWWVVGVLVVIGVGGGGYIAYSKGYLPLPFLSPDAKTLFSRMTDSLGTIKNAQYTLHLSLQTEPRASGAKSPFDNLNINSGLSDADNGSLPAGLLLFADPKTIFQAFPSDAAFDGKVTAYGESDRAVNDSNGLVKFDGSYAGGDMSFAVAAEVRKVGKDVYLTVSKFPSLPFFDVETIKGKWIRLTSDDTSGILSEAELQKTQSKETVDAIKAVFQRALDGKFLTLDRPLAAATIAGQRTHHYRVAVHPDKLAGVYQATIDARKKTNQDVVGLEKTLAEINKPANVAALKRLAVSSTIEVWVDNANGLLRQVQLSIRLVPPAGNDRLKDKQFQLTFALTLEKINERVDVAKPGSSISATEAGRLLTGEPIQKTNANTATDQSVGLNANRAIQTNINVNATTNTATNVQALDTDGDGLSDADERTIYHTDPSNPDTDGDGHPDGTEVKNGYNPLGPGKATVEQLQAWNKPTTTSVTTAPKITDVTATVSDGIVTVRWTTDSAADGIINFGPTAAYGRYANDTSFNKKHSQQFVPTAGTIHYIIRSCTNAVVTTCTSEPDRTIVVPAG